MSPNNTLEIQISSQGEGPVKEALRGCRFMGLLTDLYDSLGRSMHKFRSQLELVTLWRCDMVYVSSQRPLLEDVHTASRNTNTSEWYLLIIHASLQTTTTQCTVCTRTCSKHFRKWIGGIQLWPNKAAAFAPNKHALFRTEYSYTNALCRLAKYTCESNNYY